MQLKLFYTIGLASLLILLNSCYYDKFNEIHPLDGYKNPCDSTSDSTYTHSIRYIMSYNCTSCHNSSTASGNITLDSYEAVVEQTKNGNLMGCVQHENGYTAMPLGAKIPDCQIEKLQQWVNANYPK